MGSYSENWEFQLANESSTYHGERKVDTLQNSGVEGKSFDERGLRVGYTPRILA